jgi:predicted dehydrogenase
MFWARTTGYVSRSLGGAAGAKSTLRDMERCPTSKLRRFAMSMNVMRERLPGAQKLGSLAHTSKDVRKVLDDKSIDVISIAAPHHWHSLFSIWACQTGKDDPVLTTFGRAANWRARR